MSSKHTLVCDRCGADIREFSGVNYSGPNRIYLAVGTYPDAVGGPSQEDEKTIDLCSNCLTDVVKRLLKNRKFSTNEEYYKANQELIDWGTKQ